LALQEGATHWQRPVEDLGVAEYLMAQPETGETLVDEALADQWVAELRVAVSEAHAAAASGQEGNARVAAVNAFVGSKFGLSSTQADTLLYCEPPGNGNPPNPPAYVCVKNPENENENARDVLANELVVLPATPDTEDTLPSSVKAICQRLLKLALWQSYWQVSGQILLEACRHSTHGGWYDVANLPIAETNITASDYANFYLLVQYVKVRQTAASPGADLGPMWVALAASSVGGATEALQQVFGWKASDFTTLSNHFGWAMNASSPEGNWLNQAQACFALLRKLDTDATTLIGWAKSRNLSAADTASLKTAVASTLGTQANDRLPEVRNALRDQQAKQLSAYWAQQQAITPSEVYGRILMDPEMNACMMTSRLKMALSSVQLFIQNLALGNYASEGLEMNYEQQQSWKWRKNYRVWEANRKIFLYPENWLNPDFRDDKTSLFESLENTLNQQDVTAQTAERAYRDYLKNLRTVAQLEIMGITEGPEGTVYVFGRTYNLPHRYFFRSWHRKAQWADWQEINVDIEGEHLIPVVFNRKLVLVWPAFQEVPPTEIPTGEGTVGYTDLEVKLAYTVYEEGEWSPKVLGKEGVRLGNNPANPIRQWDMSGFYFRAQETEIGLFLAMFDGQHRAAAKFRLKNLSEKLEVWTSAQPAMTSSKILVTETYNYYNRLASAAGGKRALEIGEREPGDNTSENAEIIDRAKNRKILREVPGGFHLVMPPQVEGSLPDFPFIMQNGLRAYFIVPSEEKFSEKIRIEIDVLVESTVPVLVEEGTNTPANCPPAGLEDDFSPANHLVAPALQVDLSTQLPFTAATDFTSGGEVTQEGYQNAYQPKANESGNCSPAVNTPPVYEDRTVKTWKERKKEVSAQYKKYQFLNMYHPFVDLILDQLEKFGIDGVLDPDPTGEGKTLHRQLATSHDFDFATRYRPNTNTFQGAVPTEGFEFKYGTPYSTYNWELFFHAPYHIAKKLMENHRFEEARQWLHYLFDPTLGGDASAGPKRYWKTKPFYEYEEDYNVAGIVSLLEDGDAAFVKQLEVWQQNPFQPFALARLRTVAFMRAVVMTYLDNLIAWGDHLFRQDSIESLNEATLLYVMAGRILGPTPREVVRAEVLSAGTLTDKTDDLASSIDWKKLETVLNDLSETVNLEADINPETASIHSLLYFGIPANDKLLAYWDTLADRLFKIRNCQNIDGQTRALALFQSPIDPALLAQATAAGIDLGTLIGNLTGTPSH
ncbi:MAG: neuraminidase-like domain-containing protein, partial [Bacteroidota bacterium]